MADKANSNQQRQEIQRCDAAMRRLENERVSEAGADWACVREVRDGLVEARILRRERVA